MNSWHADSQEPLESMSHGAGIHGVSRDPGSSQIGHFVPPQRSVQSSPDQVPDMIYPPGNATLAVRNQVPGLSSAVSLTRVMSPNTQDNQMIVPANSIVLLGQECICPVCDSYTPDASLCAQCGAFGHPNCIGTEYILPRLCLLSEMLSASCHQLCNIARFSSPKPMDTILVESSCDLA